MRHADITKYIAVNREGRRCSDYYGVERELRQAIRNTGVDVAVARVRYRAVETLALHLPDGDNEWPGLTDQAESDAVKALREYTTAMREAYGPDGRREPTADEQEGLDDLARDVANNLTEDMLTAAAELVELVDKYDSGALPDANAVDNLAVVMYHLRPLTEGQATGEHSDRARHVTEQVALWLMNDGESLSLALGLTRRARRLTAAQAAREMAQCMTYRIKQARPHTAPWHVGQELAANDYGRVRWHDIVRELREAYDRDNDTTTEWNEG